VVLTSSDLSTAIMSQLRGKCLEETNCDAILKVVTFNQLTAVEIVDERRTAAKRQM
jgi:hypothetical protein